MPHKWLKPLLAFSLVAGLSAAPQQPAVEAPPAVRTAAGSAVAPEPIDATLNARIRAEGMERSKVMWIAHYLTDVYGPRPTGSPNHVAAANWAIKTMTSWGMTNGHLEPFTWNGIGWLPGKASGYITSPVKSNLKFEAVPWSPSTNGTVSGPVVLMTVPENPTEAELTAFFAEMAHQVKGGILMLGPAATVPVSFNEPQKRIPDETARARYLPPDPNAPARGRGGRGASAGGRGGRGGPDPAAEGRLTAAQVTPRLLTFLRDNPPALRFAQNDSDRIPGVIVAQNRAGQTYDQASQICPAVVLRNDDFGRIARLMADGTPVSVELTMTNQFFPDGARSYTTVAEIPGTDKADEIVMLGGHLDSWTSGTGATDNGIGVAIMMEAARILTVVDAKPRRTIRVALWSGEEQGLLGSTAYVAQHFGTAEAPKPEHAKLDAYWNIDEGTGRVRGASIFGPPEAAAILAQFFKPFEEWGIYGATASTNRGSGNTDSGAFNQAGLAGIGTVQDPIEYNSTTWHTNLDNYERIVPDDVMKSATITASVVYHLANRDAMLPRFPAATMPAPGGRGGGGRGGEAVPTAQAHIYAAARGKALSVPAPGLSANAAGTPAPAQGAPARTAAVASPPSHGKVALKADGSFVYTPTRDFAGTDSFTYTLAAGTAVSSPATVTVVVK